MKNLIIFPYYCQNEVHAYLEMAPLWENLTQHSEVSYEILLSCRYDIKPDRRLYETYSKFALVKEYQCNLKGRGIRIGKGENGLEGPSAMFWDTFNFIHQNYPRDGGLVLWFEADMILLKPNWLDLLDQEWRKGDYHLMGKLIDQEWLKNNLPDYYQKINTHINGGACYSKDLISIIPKGQLDLTRSFDMELYLYLNQYYKESIRATDLFELRYLHKTLKKPPQTGSIILHGVKDDSARRFICKQYGIPFENTNFVNRLLARL